MKRRFLHFVLNCCLLDKRKFPFLIGLCLGIALSLIQVPFTHKCQQYLPYQDLQVSLSKRGLQESIHDDQEQTVDDYDPLIIKVEVNDAMNVKDVGDRKKVNRPRYYSTELGIRNNKVLVSVLSSLDTIKTYGISINKTLDPYIDKLIFFIDGTGNRKFGLDIPIVGFKEAKPLIKSFRIISYIKENFLADFDYFFFVTDRTYINGKRLMKMLEQISVNNNIHMGLSVNGQENSYCSIGR